MCQLACLFFASDTFLIRNFRQHPANCILQTLFGFERVHVKAGESVTVNLYPSLTDFALTGIDGIKHAAVGEWTVKFGVKETSPFGQGYAEVKLATY